MLLKINVPVIQMCGFTGVEKENTWSRKGTNHLHLTFWANVSKLQRGKKIRQTLRQRFVNDSVFNGDNLARRFKLMSQAVLFLHLLDPLPQHARSCPLFRSAKPPTALLICKQSSIQYPCHFKDCNLRDWSWEDCYITSLPAWCWSWCILAGRDQKAQNINYVQ